MPLAVVVDVGGSAVKAGIAELGGRAGAAVTYGLRTLRPAAYRAELDPVTWWAATRGAVAEVVARAGRPTGDYGGLVVCSLRQGFVLTDGERELGPGVLNTDRRGADQLPRLAALGGVYETTGHWLAPELTLPKLMHLARRDPERWAATRHVLFIHDWLVWRFTGVAATEASYASAGQLLDVRRRAYADALLAEVGLGTGRLAPLVEAGAQVGRLAAPLAGELGLPVGLPVVAGAGDTQLAAMGAGGLAEGVVTVVAGSSTPVQAATAVPPVDPLRHPWVSTHAAPDRWAVETNAGYPGAMAGWLSGLLPPNEEEAASEPGARGVTAVTAAPVWSEPTWTTRPPMTVLGLRPDTTGADLRQAFAEAHAFAVRANVEDLERVLGGPARAVLLTGGGASGLAALLADVLGREIVLVEAGQPVALAGAALVAGEHRVEPGGRTVEPTEFGTAYEPAYQRYLAAYTALQAHLPERDA